MSYSIDIFTMQGKKVSTRQLHAELFGEQEVNQTLIHEYVVMYLANQRISIAHTKGRGEIRGSGKKLYKQKGTGRARVGDAGSPIRKGGGVSFGPTNEINHSKDMPKKMKRKALQHALLLKAQQGTILGVDGMEIDQPKTKTAATMLSSLELSTKTTLIVLPEHTEVVVKSFKNIPNVTYQTAQQVNAYDVMSHKSIIFVGSALDVVEHTLLS